MSNSFAFRDFVIQQKINSQKVGTDSMLLGAWSTGTYSNILDIGTGTGILALMLSQQNQSAKIFAIEPDEESLNEAIQNFTKSKFSEQISGINSSLQDFFSDEKFDLIISNPPYFEKSSLSENENKNRARHTNNLPLNVLYKKSRELISDNGNLNLIFPFDLEKVHFEEAANNGFHPVRILRTKREDGDFKRTLVSYSLNKIRLVESEMIVKFSDNSYSKEYIEMTKEFYGKDLS